MLGIMTGMGNSLQAGHSYNSNQRYTANRGMGSAADKTRAAGSKEAVSESRQAFVQGTPNEKDEGIIKPVDSRNRTGESDFPMMRKGADPAEMIIRGKIEYLDKEAIGREIAGRDQGRQDAETGLAGSEEERSPLETVKDGECQTCKNRKYQDGSDDPGVSYKTPTKISADRAASAVMGHEMEHVTRERAEAEREDRKVVSQSVVMHTAICPECGEAYVSGGTTTTVTSSDRDISGDQSEQMTETEK